MNHGSHNSMGREMGGGMSGMGGGMDMGGGCKISMLWNWYTIDSCFLAESWHITSKGMFAGSCIGVIFLVISLEFLRRLSREYERYIVRSRMATAATAPNRGNISDADSARSDPNSTNKAAQATTQALLEPARRTAKAGLRPTLGQQVLRALLHMVQFVVAYFIMLLAMYFNGYIIISIFIGAFIGSFIFSWETMGENDALEVTYCCG